MAGRKSKMTSKKTQILSILLCIALFFALAALLIWNKKNELETSKEIAKIAESQNRRGMEEAEELNSKVKAQVSPQIEESTEPEKEETQEVAAEEQQPAESEEAEDTNTAAEGVVCWGDDLINGDASATYSYMAVLQRLMTENGYNLPVVNKTLQGGGTLSMMKMAGVKDSVLQNYIASHQEKAAGAELNITETGIRDLTEEQTARNDLNCIPVIFMGYYGGWNHDPYELVEQQKHILKTFPNRKRFLIVGTGSMDGVVSSQAMDEVMSEKWGGHYISLASVTANPAASNEGQEAMGQAVFNKLVELNYITK